MNYQTLADSCVAPCAVVSVQITEDARRGDMRIAYGNQAFRDAMGAAYFDGVPCGELLPAESNFEDLCVRSAILGQRVHSYAHDEARDIWVDLTLFPLVREEDDMAHCLLFTEKSENPDPERMASVSMDTAAAAVKASVALLGTDDLKAGVKQILDDIIVRSQGFSARLTLVDDEQRSASCFCEAFVKGFFDEDDMPEVVVPYETVASWKEMLGQGNMLIIERDSDFDEVLPINPEWVASLRMFGVNSFIMTPLRQGGNTIGYLQLSNFDVSRLLEIKELMELITFLLSAQIYNHLLMQKLERMSTRDGLTGVLNRHAMLQRIDSITGGDQSEPFGVISVDLNGLKDVNDNEGHDAGDRLLVRASDLLRELFGDENFYRTGGDEFVVIQTGIGHNEFDREVEQLHEEAEASGSVSFAVGASWSDGSAELHDASLEADNLMYADKEAYYASSSKERR